MVATTPNYGLRYRTGNDPADIQSATADLASDVDTALGANLLKGQVARALQAATVNATTIEVVALTATFTAVAGRRYLVMYQGAYQGTVTGDLMALKFRWAAGASLTAAGASFRNVALSIPTANTNVPVAMIGDIAGMTAGQVTVGITIVRNNGTGQVSLNTSPGLHEGLLLVLDELA